MTELEQIMTEIAEKNKQSSIKDCNEMLDIFEDYFNENKGNLDRTLSVIVYSRNWKDMNVAKSNLSRLSQNLNEYDEYFILSQLTRGEWSKNIDDT